MPAPDWMPQPTILPVQVRKRRCPPTSQTAGDVTQEAPLALLLTT